MQEKPILVEWKNKKWNLITHKVKFIDNSTENETYTSDVDWYEKFNEMHSGFRLKEVTEVSYSQEQLERFEEVKNMVLADSVASDYIIDGITGRGLEMIALRKENKDLRQTLADLTEVVLLGGM